MSTDPPADVRDRHHHGRPTSPTSTIAIFGGVTRNGNWRVRKNTQSLALFGGIDLDLRDAIFESPVVEIAGFWCFGGLDIKVPAGIEVRDQTAGIFGGTDVRDVGEPLPGAPTLVIKGMTLFGGVSVRGPKPGKEAEVSCRRDLRASDADRDQVTEVLHAAYAEGRLTSTSTPSAPRRRWRRRPSTT